MTPLGQLASDAKVPLLSVGRHSRVLAWGNNIQGPWSDQSFTVPNEGGNMRCLFGQFAIGYFSAAGPAYMEMKVDGVVMGYNRVYINWVGHRPFTPFFRVYDLAPGVHTFNAPTMWYGTPNVSLGVNNFWSYFVLAGPVPGAAVPDTGSTAVLGNIPSTSTVSPGNTDTPRPTVHGSTDYMRGDFQAIRQTSMQIPVTVRSRVFFLMTATGYSAYQHDVVHFGALLDAGDGRTVDIGLSWMSTNDPPTHRYFNPWVWYGWLDPGTWCPAIFRSANCRSDTNDFATAIAIVGV